MKISTIALVVYLTCTLFWKLYAKTDVLLYDRDTVNYWVNAYWLYSSIFFCLLFFKISKQCIILIHKKIWVIVAGYWGVMAAIHIYICFNIALYANFVQSANKVTIGATLILISFFLITYRALKK
jgi:hypothetical protein